MTNASVGFAALGDPTRLQIFERLARRPSSVGKLSERMAVTRPAVSQHLKILKGAGLVSVNQVGTRRIYRVEQRGVELMRKYLDRFWDQALAAFKDAAEEREI
ncbi:MAG: metalloregulator ArsR/SmtB family transcription factor [Polyangiaceae bacterium]